MKVYSTQVASVQLTGECSIAAPLLVCAKCVRLHSLGLPSWAYDSDGTKDPMTESFTFSLRPVESENDLKLACRVRAEAYGRKVPIYRESMLIPDDVDLSPWTTVYLCEDKLTGEPVGTMRIQSTAGGGALEIEKHTRIPAALESSGRAEISRLSAVSGADPFMRLALWKAGYLHCMATRVRWLVLGVRKPGLLRAYQQMGAEDLTEPTLLPHGGNLMYRILGLDVLSAESKWQEKNHPLLKFMVATTHPDIEMPLVHRLNAVPEQFGVHVLQ